MKVVGDNKKKDFSWIRHFGDGKGSKSRIRPFDLGEEEIKDEKTSRINTVNR